MTAVFCIIAVVALISIYDYLSSRSWQLVTSDIRNEVVFENRNKKYGAFMIRQDYNRNMVLIMTSVVFGAGILYASYVGFRSNANEIISLPVVEDLPPDVLIPIELPQKEILPEQPKNVTKSVEQTTENVEYQIVDKTVKSDVKTQDELDKLKAGTQTQQQIGSGVGTTEIKKDPVITPSDPVDKIIEIPEVDAQFPGGYPAMAKYIQNHLNVPNDGESGKVYLRFVVGKDGEISSVKVIQGIPGCPDCDKAAMKVIKGMPDWKPGQMKGQNVSTYFDLPINFQYE